MRTRYVYIYLFIYFFHTSRSGDTVILIQYAYQVPVHTEKTNDMGGKNKIKMDPRIVDFFVKYENTARKIQCINDVLQY